MAGITKNKAAKKAGKKADSKKPRKKSGMSNEGPPPIGKNIPLNQKRAELFAEEMVKDFCPWTTLLRLGWSRNEIEAKEQAERFMNYPRVHSALSELVYGKSGIIAERTLILNKLWEEANTAREGSTRVNALVKLGTYLGMDPNSNKGDAPSSTETVEAPITDKELAEFKKRFKKQYA